jgi:hypothetical protein
MNIEAKENEKTIIELSTEVFDLRMQLRNKHNEKTTTTTTQKEKEEEAKSIKVDSVFVIVFLNEYLFN